MSTLADGREALEPVAGASASPYVVARVRQAVQNLRDYAVTRDTEAAAIVRQIIASVEVIMGAEIGAGATADRILARTAGEIEAFLRSTAH